MKLPVAMPTQNRRSIAQSYGREDGVALAILVWFLAAMSLLVAGIVMQARLDIKLTQIHAARAQVEAAADGAIQLALADFMLHEQEDNLTPTVMHGGEYTLGRHTVMVNFTPLAGLIDINQAPEGLLLLLFSGAEYLEEDAARDLAFNVVEWRSGGTPDGAGMEQSVASGATGEGGVGFSDEFNANGVRQARFESIEDLLLVPGIDRRVYETVRDSVYVSQAGLAGVDWASAPVEVLRALGGMDEAAARELVDSRNSEAGDWVSAPEQVDLSYQEEGELSAYRVDALVEYGEFVYSRRRWVDRANPGADGLPWSFIRTEAVRVMPTRDADGSDEEKANAGN